jgi:hypothetical protein
MLWIVHRIPTLSVRQQIQHAVETLGEVQCSQLSNFGDMQFRWGPV